MREDLARVAALLGCIPELGLQVVPVEVLQQLQSLSIDRLPFARHCFDGWAQSRARGSRGYKMGNWESVTARK